MFMSSYLLEANSIVKNLPGFEGDLPFTFETGYVGVGEDNEVQLFYYFVESQRDPLHDPLLFYLTGGPGCSGLYPFIFQIGPVIIDFGNSTWERPTLEENPNSWAKTASIIFVDLPVGTGFSYATTCEASKSGDSISAQHSYEFLVKWFEEHPRFLNNPLYISGISYMGLLVPIVTLEIYQGNERGDQPQLNIRSTKEACHGNYIDIDPENAICSNRLQRVDECTSKLNTKNILYPSCDVVDPDPTCLKVATTYLNYYGNDKEVRKALHVREGTVENFELENDTIHYAFKKNDSECYSYDIFSSVVYHEMLATRNCHVLIFSADHDMTFPFVGAVQWITSLNLPIETPWNPWFVDDQVAGYRVKYAKNGYSLTHATVKAAGHSIALYKPKETWVILDEWLASHSYLSDF